MSKESFSTIHERRVSPADVVVLVGAAAVALTGCGEKAPTDERDPVYYEACKNVGRPDIAIMDPQSSVNSEESNAGMLSGSDRFRVEGGVLTSIALNEGARVRADPYVKGPNDSSAGKINLLQEMDQGAEIFPSFPVCRKEDGDNGAWYGIHPHDMNQLPGVTDKVTFRSRVVWVNEQKVAITSAPTE